VIGVATSSSEATTAGVAIAYAGGGVSQKPVLRRLSPLKTILSCCVVGALVCLPFAPQRLQVDLSGRFPTAFGAYHPGVTR
jgi:hypothetical protein